MCASFRGVLVRACLGLGFWFWSFGLGFGVFFVAVFGVSCILGILKALILVYFGLSFEIGSFLGLLFVLLFVFLFDVFNGALFQGSLGAFHRFQRVRCLEVFHLSGLPKSLGAFASQ